MTASFTLTPVVKDPHAVVNEMSLVCDRIASMLSAANSVLMEDVVGRLSDNKSVTYSDAYNVWCTFQTAVERLRDVAIVLDEAEAQLRDHNQAEG